MPTLSARDLQTFPPNVGRDALERLLEETRSREVLLRETIRQFERRHHGLLEELEARLSPFSNLVMAGRLGRFWYNNMDHCIEAALELANDIEQRLRGPRQEPT